MLAALACAAASSAAPAQVTTYVGHQLASPAGTLTFTWPGSSGSLANYTEAGLRVACPGYGEGQGCTGGPRGGGCCVPFGFSHGGWYFAGGIQALVDISRAAGGSLSGLEFQLGDGTNGCTTAGNGTTYLWALVYSGGSIIGSFDVNVPTGSYVGFSGTFDRVRLGGYSNQYSRDLHQENGVQNIGLDNMTWAASPCPAFGAPADIYACADGTNTFAVSATADAAGGTLTYQWQWQILGDAAWTDVAEGPNAAAAPYAFNATGSQTSTLTRTGSLTPGSVVMYRCVVSNDCSTITGVPATLAVRSAPLITQQPLDVPLCAGPATVFLNVEATTTPSDPGPFTYQWQRSTHSNTWSAVVNGESTTGATSPNLIMQFEQTGDGAARYRCVITNPCSSTTSSAATVSYNNAPTIYAQPTSSTICAAGSAELDVDIGNQPLAAQWQYESPPNSGQYLDVSDYWTTDPATGLTFYSLGAASTGMSVQYISLGSHPPAIRFINALSDGCGSLTTTPATITICAADFDCDGTVAVADVFAFINAWFAGDPSADIDGVNGLQVADIFAFLNTWFGGC
jgi:hypothetical protein